MRCAYQMGAGDLDEALRIAARMGHVEAMDEARGMGLRDFQLILEAEKRKHRNRRAAKGVARKGANRSANGDENENTFRGAVKGPNEGRKEQWSTDCNRSASIGNCGSVAAIETRSSGLFLSVRSRSGRARQFMPESTIRYKGLITLIFRQLRMWQKSY